MTNSITTFLNNSASRYPQKIAVVKENAVVPYFKLDEMSAKISDRLKPYIVDGDRVGIFLDKSAEEVVSIFGIARSGAIFVSLNPRLKREQIIHIVRDCGIRCIITSEPLYKARLKGSLNKTTVKTVVFADTADYPIITFKSSLRAGKPPAKNIGCIIYTSGSTGKPKGVVIPHKNLIDGADIVSEYLGCKHDDRVLSLLPFSFDYGLNQLLTTVKNGATIVLKEFVFPRDTLKAIEQYKITGLAGIPTIWTSLLNVADLGSYDLSSLRYVTNSGGKIPVEYVKKMIKTFRSTEIYLMYGLTEAFRSTYLLPHMVEKKPDSIGRSIPRVTISVLNKEGRECGPDEEGELVHRGALISLGYWGNKEATDARIRPLPAGAKKRRKNEMGVFSGDIVKKDEEGFLYFLGRNDEMIKSSGYRISPTEIEEVLYKIGGLTAAVVFGKEDPDLGQKIIAVICCKGKSDISKKYIVDHCAKHLPDYAVPREIIFLDNMPKTSSGKLDRSLMKGTYGGH